MAPWIKICGNTRLEDCLMAAELGADAVGFVFAAGKRTVTAAQVAAITAHLPPALETIGVFTSRDADEIAETAAAAGLTGVQLHGPLDFTLAAALRRRFPADGRCRVVQVVHWWTDVAPEEQGTAFAAACEAVQQAGLADALLLDSRTRLASGGTGIAFDWAAAARALRGITMPLIVAGGLRPDTVSSAIATLRPWGVDVASGVERAPGIKDETLLRTFVHAATQTKG